MSGSDRDDKTGIFKDERTRVATKRVQVQMPSGKIYGPYTRDEVLGFIEIKRIRGEEKILYEGETGWRAIGSDPEFFDAIHAIISGKKIKRAEKKAEEVSGFSDHDEKTRASGRATQTEVLSTPEKLSEKTRITDAGNFDLEEKPIHFPTAPFRQASEQESSLFPPEKPKIRSPQAIKPKSKSLIPVILLGGLVLAGVYFYTESNKASDGAKKGQNIFASKMTVSAAKNYSRPLLDTIRNLPFSQIKIPLELTKVSLEGRFLFSLNAQAAANRLRVAFADVNSPDRKTTAFWEQVAIDLDLLGLKIQVVDVAAGALLQTKSKELVEKLVASKLWEPETALLHELLVAHATGDWDKIINEAGSSRFPVASWLKADAIWWKSWAEGKLQKAPPEKEVALSAELEIIAKIRDAFMGEDPQVATWLLQLASIDPESPYLWFVSAELNWRKNKSVQVDTAYRDFMIGIASLSLYPPALQLAYWTQFGDFLRSYARSETFNRALGNVSMLSRGNIGAPSREPLWWDIQDEGLDAKSVAEEVLSRSSRGMLNARDRAALLVLGQGLPDGEDYLFVVGTHLCFEEQWSDAEQIFDDILLRDSKNKDALFGKIWTQAKQFRFVEAQDLYAQFVRYSLGDLVHLRSKGLIHYLGREFDQAHTIFEDYLKQKPNDAWALYFNAEAYLVQKDYLGCVKSANLAKVQGRGELGFRAELLFFKCRVKANLGLKDSLDSLSRLIRETPDSLPMRILFIELMNESALRIDAIRTLDESLKYFPFSAKLKIAAGKLYEAQGEIGKSLDYYYQAAQLEPGAAEPWVKMAGVLEAQEKYSQAAQNFETAARIQPGYPEVYLFTARAYEKAKKNKEAAYFYEKEIEVRPEALGTFVEAAEFFLRNNTPQQVPIIYRKFQGGFQEDPRALVRLAQAYNSMGDLGNAKSFASRAVAGDPENPYVNLILANILDRAGEYHLAKRYYSVYLTLLPQAPESSELRDRLSKPPYSN